MRISSPWGQDIKDTCILHTDYVHCLDCSILDFFCIQTAILLLRIDDIVSGTKKKDDADRPQQKATAQQSPVVQPAGGDGFCFEIINSSFWF